MEEKAIQFVMQFYRISREVALEFYKDEISAYIRIMELTNEN